MLQYVATAYDGLPQDLRRGVSEALDRWGVAAVGRSAGLSSLRDLAAAVAAEPQIVGHLGRLVDAKGPREFLESARGALGVIAGLPTGLRTRVEAALFARGPGQALAAAGIAGFDDLLGLSDAALGALDAATRVRASFAARPPDWRGASEAAAALGGSLAALPAGVTAAIERGLRETEAGRLSARLGVESLGDLVRLLSAAPGAVDAASRALAARKPGEFLEALSATADLVASLPDALRGRIEGALFGDETHRPALHRAGLRSFDDVRGASAAGLRALAALYEAEAAMAAPTPDLRALAGAVSRLAASYDAVPANVRERLDAAFKAGATPFVPLGIGSAADLARIGQVGPSVLIHLYDLGTAALARDGNQASQAFAALVSDLGSLPPAALSKLEAAAGRYLFGDHLLGRALACAGIQSVSDLVAVLRAGAGAVRAVRALVQCAVARDSAGAWRESVGLLADYGEVPEAVRARVSARFRDSVVGEGVSRLLGLLPGELSELVRAAPAALAASAALWAAVAGREVRKAFAAASDALAAMDAVPSLQGKVIRNLASQLWDLVPAARRPALSRLGLDGPAAIAPVLTGGPRVVAALGDLWEAAASGDAGRIVLTAGALVRAGASGLPPEFGAKLLAELSARFALLRHLTGGAATDAAAGLAQALANPLVLGDLTKAADELRRGAYGEALGSCARLMREGLRGNPALQRSLLSALGRTIPGAVGELLRDRLVVEGLVGTGAADRLLTVLEAFARGEGTQAMREMALLVRDVAMKDGAPSPEGMKLVAGLARRFVDLLPAPVKAQALRMAGLAAERNVPVIGWILSGLLAIPDAIELTRMLIAGRATPEEIACKAAELGLDIAGMFGPVGAAVAGAGGVVLGLLRVLLQARRISAELFGPVPAPAADAPR